MSLVPVRLQCNDATICGFFSAPQRSPGSRLRSGLRTHLRLLHHAVYQSAHQKQHPLFLPGRSCSTTSARRAKTIRTLPSSLVFQFCPLRPACSPRRSALLPALCPGRTGDVRWKVKGSLRPGGWTAVSFSNGKGGALWKMWTRQGRRGTTRDPSLVRPPVH